MPRLTDPPAPTRPSGARRAAGIVGASLAATTGLLALYAGNPRLPRAYAATNCQAVTSGSDTNTPGTLRYALNQVVAATCNRVPIQINAPTTLTLTADLPEIALDAPSVATVEIVGDSDDRFTIDGDGKYQALSATYSNANPNGRALFVSYLTITNTTAAIQTTGITLGVGYSTISETAATGNPAIVSKPYNPSTAPSPDLMTYLLGVTVSDNALGGLDAHGADVRVVGSDFTNNGTGPGSIVGGIRAAQDVTVLQSTFDGNHGPSGGAINDQTASSRPAGTINIVNSVFTNNRAVANNGRGGAVHATGPWSEMGQDNGTIAISDSTFSGNEANGYGGAVFEMNMDTRITNSTVTGNQSTGVPGGVGGVSLGYSDNVLNFNTITSNSAKVSSANLSIWGGYYRSYTTQLNGNALSNPVTHPANCNFYPGKYKFDSIVTQQYTVVGNAAGDDTSCGTAAPGEISLATTAAINLGALADNGGPTRTMLPGTGSVLIGGAPDGLGTGITTDQRGEDRTGLFTVGSVQVPANLGPTGLKVRWAPGTIMSRWNPVIGATKYQTVLTLKPRGGTATTRRATTAKTQQNWLVKPAPRTPYTVCVRAHTAGGWSNPTCKDSTVGTAGWRSAGKTLPNLSGSIGRAIR